MAYVSRTYKKGPWSGPYPHLAGEFCGNVLLSHIELTTAGIVHQRLTTGRDGEQWSVPRNDLRAGRPAPSKQRTSEELANNGFVGLYLLGDTQLHMTGTTKVVETDALTEEVVSGQRPAAMPFVPVVPMLARRN